jgi:hypothetical protein
MIHTVLVSPSMGFQYLTNTEWRSPFAGYFFQGDRHVLFFLGGSKSLISAHWASVNSCRFIFLFYHFGTFIATL